MQPGDGGGAERMLEIEREGDRLGKKGMMKKMDMDRGRESNHREKAGDRFEWSVGREGGESEERNSVGLVNII